MEIGNWFDKPEELEIFRKARIREGGNPEHVDAYLDSLVRHVRCVQEAGKLLKINLVQLQEHDRTKFSDAEFLAAAENWHGGAPNPNRYAAAWLHHIHHNPHHWQHWIFPDGFIPKGADVEKGVMEMPHRYAMEMIADWMGSSMAYTGSWDIAEWLMKNMPRIRLHSKTARLVTETLDMLGYADVVSVQRWAQEIPADEAAGWKPLSEPPGPEESLPRGVDFLIKGGWFWDGRPFWASGDLIQSAKAEQFVKWRPRQENQANDKS